MKVQMKALAAAALLCVSGLASAVIDPPSTGASSEMFLIAYDPVNQVTYTRDLGTTAQEFNFATSTSIALDGFSSFVSTVNGFGATAINSVRWSLMAYQISPIATFFASPTASGNATGTSNPNQARMSAINGNEGALVGQHNLVGANASSTDGWSIISGAGAAQGATLFTSQNNLASPIVASGLLSESLRFFSFTNATAGGSTRTQLGGTAADPALFALNTQTGTLTYTTVAAVPEPGTYALMLAGLMTLGAVVRRRAK